jgi:hypothetical protein
MASAFDGIDTSNPCAVLPVLRSALYRMAAGESEVRVKYEEFDTTVQAVALPELRRLVNDLEQRCARLSGGRRRRFAMRAGY